MGKEEEETDEKKSQREKAGNCKSEIRAMVFLVVN